MSLLKIHFLRGCRGRRASLVAGWWGPPPLTPQCLQLPPNSGVQLQRTLPDTSCPMWQTFGDKVVVLSSDSKPCQVGRPNCAWPFNCPLQVKVSLLPSTLPNSPHQGTVPQRGPILGSHTSPKGMAQASTSPCPNLPPLPKFPPGSAKATTVQCCTGLVRLHLPFPLPK